MAVITLIFLPGLAIGRRQIGPDGEETPGVRTVEKIELRLAAVPPHSTADDLKDMVTDAVHTMCGVWWTRRCMACFRGSGLQVHAGSELDPLETSYTVLLCEVPPQQLIEGIGPENQG